MNSKGRKCERCRWQNQSSSGDEVFSPDKYQDYEVCLRITRGDNAFTQDVCVIDFPNGRLEDILGKRCYDSDNILQLDDYILKSDKFGEYILKILVRKKDSSNTKWNVQSMHKFIIVDLTDLLEN